MAQTHSRGYLFESMPIPKAVMERSAPLAVYNLLDDFFVGMMMAYAQCITEVIPALAAVVMLLQIFRQKTE